VFFTVLAQFLVTRGTGSPLEGFSFTLLVGILAGTYSTIFIATPIVLWIRNREVAQAAKHRDQAKTSVATVSAK
jgi:preprotein translocase subunit SecF